MPSELIDYCLRITPGLALVAAAVALARPLRDPLGRIMMLVSGFVLIRDAMTPAGLWRLGTDGGLWLRFTDDAVSLVLLGAGSLLATVAVLRFDPRLRALVRWGPVGPGALGVGLGGGVLAAAPVLAIAAAAGGTGGGPVAAPLLPLLLCFALAGNLAEEVLFRGFVQGRLEADMSPVRAALLSGVLFAACHAFLASTVTDLGWPLVLFTLYEGLICAFVRLRYGVASAAVAHGLAIFLIAAGLW